MEFDELVMNRRSIRSFKEKEVGEDEIIEILETAQMSPSAGNLQARDFIVVEKEENKRAIVEASNQEFIQKAPYVIIVCANKERSSKRYGERGRSLYSIQDADAATMVILLKAHSMGLGTCWIGAFNEEKIRKEFEIPKEVRPVTIIPIGYPNREPDPPKRKNLKELIHRKNW